MESALYEGIVRHRRFTPRRHHFVHPLFMLYVDLDELAEVGAVSRLLSTTRRLAVAWIRRGDYFGDPRIPWAEGVRRLVEARTGHYPAGAVRLLTHPRTLGVRMNPVSFYYCHDGAGRLAAVVAEVTNTPWGERHLYVLEAGEARGDGSWRARFAKELHVSPFLAMDYEYECRLLAPGARLLVHMENHREGRKIFDATLRLQRRPLTAATLRRALLRHPAMTVRICSWIYLHAAWLKLAGVPFHPHPRSGPSNPSLTPPAP